MGINKKTHIRDSERRKKRFIVPIIYFFAESVLSWLILSLIQVEFYISNWSFWAVVVFVLGVGYSIAKMIHVFERQKDYPKPINKK
ncbi:MAG: Unknown protein [uncultured Sulfurovum sp.]|uniref:Uncharacterized protein n=1 Tax=uncultured Sulfurovum sp. TaxID=269237 RepID=A0A6S6TFW2_9BACT|nr:MAG: Unknown protein [uncultured Sulfurovum sp.]